MLPTPHPYRDALAEEVHARPPMALTTPLRASHIAVVLDVDARAREHAHIAQLCEHFGVTQPQAGATHFVAKLSDQLMIKWERHGEFSRYKFIAPGEAAQPFAHNATDALPEAWLGNTPGKTIAAAHIIMRKSTDTLLSNELLAQAFNGNQVIGAEVGDGAGVAYSDFKIHADGFSRFVLIDRSLTPRQAGRTLQRLMEIESYRMMALLALPIARELSPRILSIEKSLAELTSRIASESDKDEALLHELTRLAGLVESGLAASQFRFGACRAYSELVNTRLQELREKRIEGVPTMGEFMARRFTPAVATCSTVSARLHELSERVAQASALLSTRVSIAREQQNQQLLTSMDKRAKLQLRLQQTVEGLSVAAIVYYVAGLIGYLAKGAVYAGANVKPDVVVAVAIPVVALLIFYGMRRIKRKIADAELNRVSSGKP
jgi:uncharacterized membrane-anchored protein